MSLADVRSMSLDELAAEIDKIQARDEQLQHQLDGLLSARGEIEKQLITLNAVAKPLLVASEQTALAAHNRIDTTAMLAHHIAAQVRELDTAQSRLRSVVARVEGALDLTTALADARTSFARRDWEACAQRTFHALHAGRAQALSAAASSSGVGIASTSTPASAVAAAKARAQQFTPLAALGRTSALDTDPSRVQLVELERQLGTAILADCHAAAKRGDHKGVWRLARLLPMADRSLEGLELYCAHVRVSLRDDMQRRAFTIDSQPKGAVLPFLDLAAGSFDLIATTLANHRAAVDRYFGGGASLFVIHAVHAECDLLLQPLLARFVADRRLSALIADARARKLDSHAARNRASVSSTVGAAESTDAGIVTDPRRLDALLEEVAFVAREADLFDRDVRSLEAAACDALRRVADDATIAPAPVTGTDAVQTTSGVDATLAYRARRLLEELTARRSITAKAATTAAASVAAIPALVHASHLNEAVQELTGNLVALEELYMMENVKRALAMDAPVPLDTGDAPATTDAAMSTTSSTFASAAPSYAHTTSAVDDVFFVLRKSAERAFSTCNVSVGCAVLNHVNSILTNELRRRLELGLGAALGNTNAAHELRQLQTQHASSALPQHLVLPFALNNLECATRYTQQLGDQLATTFAELFAQRVEEQQMLRHCLDDVRVAAKDFRKLNDNFFDQVARAGGAGAVGAGGVAAGELISKRARVALKTWEQLAYELSESDYAKVQQNASSAVVAVAGGGGSGGSSSSSGGGVGVGDDANGDGDDDDEDNDESAYDARLAESALVSSEAVVRAILMAVDQRLRPLKATLSEDNFDSLSHAVVQFLVKQIEQLIMKKRFSFWGGLQLDKDLRMLMNYFASICQRTTRDKFSRLTQICSVLQLEKISEITDYFSDNRAVWRLEAADVRRILALRSDFSQKAIAQLRL